MGDKNALGAKEDALPGRAQAIKLQGTHYVLGNPIVPPFADGLESCVFATGCFWGTEKAFWRTPGVNATAVMYAGGYTPNPTYEEVCSGQTGHTEASLVVWDPQVVSFVDLLGLFWSSHDPTTAMRQGNDVGTQYRSGIYCKTDAQHALAQASATAYKAALAAEPRKSSGNGPEIV